MLYAVGGFDGERRLSSVERYDPEADTWSEVAPLNRPRSGAGTCVFFVFKSVVVVIQVNQERLICLDESGSIYSSPIL